MKRKSKSKSANVPKVDPYLEGLMGKLLERIVGLERKMDTLIAQTSSKGSNNSNVTKIPQIQEAKLQPPRRERTLYEAVCADCSKVCEVPFKPSEDRAVYCKTCFAKRKSGGAGNPFHPVLTPVAMPPKPVSKPLSLQPTPVPAAKSATKAKKVKPSKKSKKKK